MMMPAARCWRNSLALECGSWPCVAPASIKWTWRPQRNSELPVTRVPNYSPYSVAEHTIALILALNRKLHRAFNRVRELNFSLTGLEGFDLHGKTAGIFGTGKIGRIVAEILKGFGMRMLGLRPVSFHGLGRPARDHLCEPRNPGYARATSCRCTCR